MNLNRLTIKSQEALERARQLAEESGHQEISSAHLLMALLQEEGGLVQSLLKKTRY